MNWDRGLFRVCIFLSIIGLLFINGNFSGGRVSCAENAFETWAITFDCYWSSYKESLFYWVVLTAILFSIRWVILGFKKTTAARNWPECSDE